MAAWASRALAAATALAHPTPAQVLDLDWALAPAQAQALDTMATMTQPPSAVAQE